MRANRHHIGNLSGKLGTTGGTVRLRFGRADGASFSGSVASYPGDLAGLLPASDHYLLNQFSRESFATSLVDSRAQSWHRWQDVVDAVKQGDVMTKVTMAEEPKPK